MNEDAKATTSITLDQYPFLDSPHWNEPDTVEAFERLESLPEADRPRAVAMVDGPGVPFADGLTMLRILAAMTQRNRLSVFEDFESGDVRSKSRAISCAAGKPEYRAATEVIEKVQPFEIKKNGQVDFVLNDNLPELQKTFDALWDNGMIPTWLQIVTKRRPLRSAKYYRDDPFVLLMNFREWARTNSDLLVIEETRESITKSGNTPSLPVSAERFLQSTQCPVCGGGLQILISPIACTEDSDS